MSDTNVKTVLEEMEFNDNGSIVSSSKKDDQDNESSENVSKEFQEMVVKYVKLDDLVRKKEKEIKELKSQRKPCEEFILKYLTKVKENVVDITNGKLRINKFESKTSLKQEIIKDALTEKVKDPLVVDDIIKLMDTMRPTSTRTNLKRTGKRQKKSTDDTDTEATEKEEEKKEA